MYVSNLVTRWRDHAKAVREQGTMERRNWNPDPDSGHFRLYKRWQRLTGKTPGQENFCHYWRVVVFWAPLALLRYSKLGSVLGAIFRRINLRPVVNGFDAVMRFLFLVHPQQRYLGWLRPWLVLPLALVVASFFSRLALVVLLVLLITIGVIAVLGVVSLLIGVSADLYGRHSAVKMASRPAVSLRKGGHQATAPRPKRRGFWRAFAAFCALLWAVVLTNKWKICPLVDIASGGSPKTI